MKIYKIRSRSNPIYASIHAQMRQPFEQRKGDIYSTKGNSKFWFFQNREKLSSTMYRKCKKIYRKKGFSLEIGDVIEN